NLLLGSLKGVGFSPLVFPVIAHAERVVEADEVRAVLAATTAQRLDDEARHEDAGQPDKQAAQAEQDQLLDNQPAPVALLRLEEEFHAAQRMRLKRMRLIRWIRMGALTRAPPATMYQGCRNSSIGVGVSKAPWSDLEIRSLRDNYR